MRAYVGNGSFGEQQEVSNVVTVSDTDDRHARLVFADETGGCASLRQCDNQIRIQVNRSAHSVRTHNLGCMWGRGEGRGRKKRKRKLSVQEQKKKTKKNQAQQIIQQTKKTNERREVRRGH